MRERAWRRDRAFAFDLLDEVWPALLLGLVVSVGVLVWTLGDPYQPELGALTAGSTWPLVCLVPIAAWVGVSATGGSTARLGFVLARPIARGRWLAVRLLAGGVAVLVMGSVVQCAAALGGFLEIGPPLPLVVGAVVGALGIGALAGACTTTETASVGGMVVGLVFLLGPAVLLDSYGVTWTAVDRAVGELAWPWALAMAAVPFAGLRRVVPDLPRRRSSRIAQASAVTGAGYAAAVLLAWVPAIEAATDPVNNRVVAIEGRAEGPIVRYTATGDVVDGITVEHANGTVVALWGGGRERGQVVEAWPSEDGRSLAVAVVPPEHRGRCLLLFDLETGQYVASPRMNSSANVERWLPGGRGVVIWERDVRREGPSTDVMELSLDFGVESKVLPFSASQGDVSSGPHRVVARRLALWASLGAGGRHFAATFEDLDSGQEVSVPLGMFDGRFTGGGWLDEQHFAVLLVARAVFNAEQRRDSWLFVVSAEGEVVIDLHLPDSQITRVDGPALGPWRATTKFGGLLWIHPSGETGRAYYTRNLGSRHRPWAPYVLEQDAMRVVGDGGLYVSLPLREQERFR